MGGIEGGCAPIEISGHMHWIHMGLQAHALTYLGHVNIFTLLTAAK